MWLHTLRRHFSAILVGNLIWEAARLPLDTLWKAGTARDLSVAVMHCTAGAFAISASTLVTALVLVGDETWPRSRFGTVAGSATATGVAYTIHSERTSVLVLRTWGYSDLMLRTSPGPSCRPVP